MQKSGDVHFFAAHLNSGTRGVSVFPIPAIPDEGGGFQIRFRRWSLILGNPSIGNNQLLVLKGNFR